MGEMGLPPFLLDRPCLRFICTDNTGGRQPHADSSPGLTPVLGSSQWQTETSTLEPSWWPGRVWELEPELEVELLLQPRGRGFGLGLGLEL